MRLLGSVLLGVAAAGLLAGTLTLLLQIALLWVAG